MIISRALSHEKNTAAFYRELARSAPLPPVKAALQQLAEEEESHVAHLEAFAATRDLGHLA